MQRTRIQDTWLPLYKITRYVNMGVFLWKSSGNPVFLVFKLVGWSRYLKVSVSFHWHWFHSKGLIFIYLFVCFGVLPLMVLLLALSLGPCVAPSASTVT